MRHDNKLGLGKGQNRTNGAYLITLQIIWLNHKTATEKVNTENQNLPFSKKIKIKLNIT